MFRRPIKAGAGAFVALALAIWSVMPESAHAQEDERERLETIQEEINERSTRQERLSQQARTAGEQARELTRQMVALASVIQTTEQELSDLDEQLTALRADEAEKAKALAVRRNQLSKTLAALQRLGQQPLELLLIRPNQGIDTVRGAGLLSSVLPELQSQARQIRNDINALQDVRSAAEANRQAYRTELASLQERQDELDRLRTERERQRRELEGEAADEAEAIAQLAEEAESLEELIAAIEREQQQRREAAAAAADRIVEEERIARPALPPGAEPFETARGSLPLPARGNISQRFGDQLMVGKSQGIRITTRFGAQVISPYDGKIVFAGPFRNYGQLLIIDHGDGYHSLLAGMEQIYGSVGQWVLSGEPIGAMTVNKTLSNNTSSSSDSAPELYVELRRGGDPIDPIPWLEIRLGKVG